MNSRCVEILVQNLKSRNIMAYLFNSRSEVSEFIVSMVSKDSSVGIGNSQTLKALGINELLTQKGCLVFDKTVASNKDEVKDIIQKAAYAYYYFSSSNAISLAGHIVNVDHTGNRVSALLYGPEEVVIIVGINKIVNSLDEAIRRVKNIAAIQNAKRAGLNPPCVELGQCVDCRSADRVCNSLVIIEGQVRKDRMFVLIIKGELGL